MIGWQRKRQSSRRRRSSRPQSCRPPQLSSRRRRAIHLHDACAARVQPNRPQSWPSTPRGASRRGTPSGIAPDRTGETTAKRTAKGVPRRHWRLQTTSMRAKLHWRRSRRVLDPVAIDPAGVTRRHDVTERKSHRRTKHRRRRRKARASRAADTRRVAPTALVPALVPARVLARVRAHDGTVRRSGRAVAARSPLTSALLCVAPLPRRLRLFARRPLTCRRIRLQVRLRPPILAMQDSGSESRNEADRTTTTTRTRRRRTTNATSMSLVTMRVRVETTWMRRAATPPSRIR
mmetsp:Transcript_13618/g.41071  ORF Transcript_13618/g.41071 Transcript_13618/m.41071 type:complete len:291 (+) Transcript_13618:1009-1881(+)